MLEKLGENVQLNGLSKHTCPAVSVEELDWTDATEEKLKEIGADTVIAAGQSCLCLEESVIKVPVKLILI